jgi:glucan biosynthesis protein C
MSTPRVADRPDGGGRLPWIDQLRTMVIVLVVNMHACVTYSHIGGWYDIKEPPEPPLPAKLLFAFWQGHLQAFFMGILFLVERLPFARAPSAAGDRPASPGSASCSLGAPTLLYMVAILHPFIVFVP